MGQCLNACGTNDACDDNDACTVDVCNAGVCSNTVDCAVCGGLSSVLELTTDSYPAETAWDIKEGNTVKYSGKDYTDPNKLHTIDMCFPPDSYTFTITDAFGDGICCSYGQGQYLIKVGNTEVVSGGEFGASLTETFTVENPSPTTSPPISSPTSPPISPPTSPPTPPQTPLPTLSPTLPPTNVGDQCESETEGDPTTVKHWALCGKKNRCRNEANGVFTYDVLHEVRCCSDSPKEGWRKRRRCAVWAQSNFDGVCHSAKNFFEANCICEKYDARLCTKAELNKNCARGTGCGFDNNLIWTETEE